MNSKQFTLPTQLIGLKLAKLLAVISFLVLGILIIGSEILQTADVNAESSLNHNKNSSAPQMSGTAIITGTVFSTDGQPIPPGSFPFDWRGFIQLYELHDPDTLGFLRGITIGYLEDGAIASARTDLEGVYAFVVVPNTEHQRRFLGGSSLDTATRYEISSAAGTIVSLTVPITPGDTPDPVQIPKREDWEVIDPEFQPGSGIRSSAAFDSQGKLHITYSSYITGDLSYGVKDGTQWTTEVITTSSQTGGFNVLALDGDETPHLLFGDDNKIKYATKVGSSWEIETIYADPRGNLIHDPGLVTDDNNRVHIAYGVREEGNNEREIFYGVRESGLWITETVTSDWEGGDIILNLNEAGDPVIVYFACSIMHAQKDNGSWQLNTIYGAEWPNCVPDVELDAAFDSQDNLHVVYQDIYPIRINHAVWDGERWQRQLIDGDYVNMNAVTGFGVALSIDINDDPHVSYYYQSEYGAIWNELRYALWTGSEWEISRITDIVPINGLSTDLLFTPENTALISHFNDQHGLSFAESTITIETRESAMFLPFIQSD